MHDIHHDLRPFLVSQVKIVISRLHVVTSNYVHDIHHDLRPFLVSQVKTKSVLERDNTTQGDMTISTGLSRGVFNWVPHCTGKNVCVHKQCRERTETSIQVFAKKGTRPHRLMNAQNLHEL